MTEFYTPQEVATILRMSYEKALAFIKYSGVVYVQIGRQYLVRKDVLDKFLSSTHPIIIDISEN